MIDERFRKPYDPKATEATMYRVWEESGFFNPDNLPGERKEPFTIILPPPNVTGTLHMGSALMLVIEDILIRYKRMHGFAALWLPGTDSAAIATQAKVEKEIQKKEGKSRYDLGREELLKRIDTFVEENKGMILAQTRAMGASVDWSRYAYTMDAPRYKAVMEAFTRMHSAGLIYRGNRIVNWDPKGQTTISDDEIVYEERPTTLYTFRYSKDFPIPISTTRPETKVGDTAVAVHPDDARYKEFVGKEYDLTFCDVSVHIQVIADQSVDPEFGTGAVGVTPAHSHTDWEMADRHDLPRPQVINERAKMTVPGRLNDMKAADAREAVVAWLRDEGLLEKEEDITHNVATAERTGGLIEPMPKLQWFVDVDKPFTIPHSEIPTIESGSETTLKALMHAAVLSGAVDILSEQHTKTYFHWITNLRDWCISRQIWFGHRIPVWYKGEEMYVGLEAPLGEGWEQDPDVLDTWFSSALWTFSTLGWPEKTEDLARFHPTDVLETGYDILFFWVARMILASAFLLGTVPFKTVFLHGLVRDEQGRKLSKSLGNNIDPINMVETYGADAVRISLIAGTAPGTDSKISESKIKGYKHFTNKIWNITRFVLENTAEANENAPLTDADQKHQEELRNVTTDVTKHLDTYRIDLAADRLYHYIWHTFADEILEESKPILKGEDIPAADSRKRLLLDILKTSLALLHPFMPFVTEAIWGHLPGTDGKLLMVSPWPTF